MRAIQVTEFGGPEVLELREVPEPEVADGLVAIDVSAAGINYADTHQAENSYLAPASLPLVPGGEVAGTTSSGERVVALLAGGGYAERAVAHPSVVFPIPDGVSDGEALALVLQGATAWHLLRTSAHLAEGESVVVHAGAGGVGTLAVQLARRWGAGTIIATASSEEKRALAVELGADAAIDGSPDGLKDRIQEAAGGKVDVVLEMVGGPTFDASLAALAPFGRLVAYGMASREQPTPVEPGALMARSRAVVGFWLAHCIGRPEMLRGAVSELLALVAAGELRAIVGGTYPLSEARRAHEDIRGRRTTGKLVLDPRG
ncbi:MAG: zinc-binding alcohol dehydrogenase family protein [Solirubrobacteraceae bacterium]